MQAPKAANLDKTGLLILIRSTLLALDHANKTGNYTTFRDLGSPNFSVANDPSRLSEIFSSLRRDRLDLSGASVMEPTIIKQQIVGNGMLDIAGFFPSASQQLNFEILYEPINGQWRLYGISANTGPTAPSAPTPPQQEQTQGQKK